MVSDAVNVCLRSRFKLTLGENDLSKRPTAATNAWTVLCMVCTTPYPRPLEIPDILEVHETCLVEYRERHDYETHFYGQPAEL